MTDTPEAIMARAMDCGHLAEEGWTADAIDRAVKAIPEPSEFNMRNASYAIAALHAAGYEIVEGWKPIDEEAKNGTLICLRGDGIYHGIEFVGKRRPAMYPGDNEHWWNANSLQRIDYDHCITHWRPRPAPPAAAEESGE